MHAPSRCPDLALTATSNHGSKRELYEQYGLRPLLAFFSHRVVRSGPRLLLYLALFISALVVVTRCLSVSIADLSIVASSGHLWRQHLGSNSDSSSSGHPLSGFVEYGDASGGGGLRIVVFGENDIATSIHPYALHTQVDHSNISWTQELCSELACSTHMSFVPVMRTSRRSLISNKLYAEAADSMVEKAKSDYIPAHDYSFVSAAYPTCWEVPDLAAQVASFLDQPKPGCPPKETLWVFSFGFWDIWSLSAYPYDIADGLISSLVAEIFYHIDTIYAASLDNNSVAYSSFTAASAPKKRVVANGQDLPWDDASAEPFRVVLPLLLDPSLVPGWHLDRPEAPQFHTKSEQVRNAVRLTKRWNEVILFEKEGWAKKNAELVNETGAPGAVQDDPAATAPNVDAGVGKNTGTHRASPTVNISQKKKRATVSVQGELMTTVKKKFSDANIGDDPSRLRRRLWRDAIILRPSEYIMDAVIDGQMHDIGVKDKNGFGAFLEEDSFQEVKQPCILSSEEGLLVNTTDNSGHNVPQSSNVAAGDVCDSPDDYLFLTSFSLGRRAIREVGRISAAIVRMDMDTRGKLEKALKPSLEPDRKPTSWKLYFDMV